MYGYPGTVSYRWRSPDDEDRCLFVAIARDLLPQLLPVTLGVRLLGLTQSGLTELESLELSSLTKQMVNTQRTFDF